jgi:hypothetical protein
MFNMTAVLLKVAAVITVVLLNMTAVLLKLSCRWKKETLARCLENQL